MESVTRLIEFILTLGEHEQAAICMSILPGLNSHYLATIAGRVDVLSKRDFMDLLPLELCLRILSYLDDRSVCRCALVSKRWHLVGTDFQIWMPMFLERGWALSPSFLQTQFPITDKFSMEPEPMFQDTDDIVLHNDSLGYGSLPHHMDEGSFFKTFPNPLLVKQRFRNVPEIDYSKHLSKLKWKHIYAQRKLLDARWRHGRYQTREIHGHQEAIYCIQFDADKIVTGSKDNTVKIFNFSGECLRTLVGHAGSVLALQFVGDILVTGSSDATIIRWNLRTGEKVWRVKAHQESVLSLRFNEQTVCTCSKDAMIKLWDLRTGVQKMTLHGHSAAVNAVQLTEKYIVSASGDRTIRVWDLESGQPVSVLKGHLRGIACIKVLKDIIVSGSSDHTIKIWDLNKGTLLQSLEGHFDLVRTVEITPNFIISGSYDETVKIWDVLSGQLLQTLILHTARVFRLQVSDTKMISVSQDRRIIITDFSSGLDTRFFE